MAITTHGKIQICVCTCSERNRKKISGRQYATCKINCHDINFTDLNTLCIAVFVCVCVCMYIYVYVYTCMEWIEIYDWQNWLPASGSSSVHTSTNSFNFSWSIVFESPKATSMKFSRITAGSTMRNPGGFRCQKNSKHDYKYIQP